MSQYRTGSVTTVSGEATVVGSGTNWLTEVAVGDLFKKRGAAVAYAVAAVPSDTEIQLNANYAASGEPGINYVISRDFTPEYDIPEINVGDLDWPVLLTTGLRIIDTELAACARVTDLTAGYIPYHVDTDERLADSPIYTDGASVFINDTTNAKSAKGLTINQGAEDDEILTLKSSDVGHTVTTDTEADTFGLFKKYSATLGGLLIRGITDATSDGAIVVEGIIGATDPTDSHAAVILIGSKQTGTTVAALGAAETVFKLRNRTTDLVTVLGSGAITFASSITTTDITDSGLTALKPVFTDENKKLVSTGTLAIDQGGTGQITAALAFAALKQDATTSATGVVELATSTESVAGSSTTLVNTPSGAAAQIAVHTNPKQMAQGVNMTYAASGSSGIVVADNDNIDFGTGNFTLVWRGSLPDWTPADFVRIFNRTGLALQIDHESNGKIRLYRDAEILSTVGNTFANNTVHEIAAVFDATALTVTFYADGLQLGDAVSTTAVDVSSASDLHIVGSATERFASTTNHAYTFNRALSAAEVLDLYRNGVAPKHRKASQTALTSGTLVAGQEYTIDTLAAGDDFANVGGTNETGNVFVATGTAPTTWTNSSSLRATGGTLILEPEGIQPAPGQWLDSSSNKLHALMPATGATRTRADMKDAWAMYTTGSTSQYLHNGTTRAILPASNYWIDEIYAYSAGTPTFTVGDSSAAPATVVASTTLVAATWTKLALIKNSTTADDIYCDITAGGAAIQFRVRYHLLDPA